MSTSTFEPFDDGKKTLVMNSSMFGGPEKSKIFNIPFSEFSKHYAAYENGMLIQDAFPLLTTSEREFLITGITDDEWDELFDGDVEMGKE
jgi:hypothetical protein